MSKSLRFSETIYRRSLWIVAFIFGSFLVGFGSAVVRDLPKVERALTLEDFIDPSSKTLKDTINSNIQRVDEANVRLQQNALVIAKATAASRSSTEAFQNWVSTRNATGSSGQDAELIERTARLDALKAQEFEAIRLRLADEKAMLDAKQAQSQGEKVLRVLEDNAGKQLAAATHKRDLWIFLSRLALTLPLLVIAGWLFAKKRKGTYWPFVWGFIYFALFAFFVELVPYLPSFGGYVRYTVGIVITVAAGRYAIIGLNNYLARQKLAEEKPEVVRRHEMSYDVALVRLDKGVCPGCERAVDLKNPAIDFCPHCGIGLFDHCSPCSARKSAFSKFCPACGVAPEKTESLRAASDIMLSATGLPDAKQQPLKT